MATKERPQVVMVTPVAPRPTGNGLAMRQWMFLHGLLTQADVHLVVPPIWQGDEEQLPAMAGLLSATALPPDRPAAGARVRSLLTDSRWLPRRVRPEPVYEGALRAAATRVAELRSLFAGREVAAVVSMQLALAPLGTALAQSLDVPLVVDLADDDEAYLGAAGLAGAAATVGRIAADCLPHAAVVTTPSPEDAAAIARRHGLGSRVVAIPNAVELPTPATATSRGAGRILFVGTLTYPPNVDAARWLVREVSPRLTRPHRIELVGAAGRSVASLSAEDVLVCGSVPDLAPYYSRADVVVAPLRSGSGTRIKILEAFAQRRPVVSTTLGAAGLDVDDGRELYLADSADSFAAAVDRVLGADDLTAMLDAAYRLVSRDYELEATARRVGKLVRGTVVPR